MYKKIILFFSFLISIQFAESKELLRSYHFYDCENTLYSNEYCLDCLGFDSPITAGCGFARFLSFESTLFPTIKKMCYFYDCWNGCMSETTFYTGYIDPRFRYFDHFQYMLKYYNDKPECRCYWPEYSAKAAKISDKAYLLFADLLSTTSMSSLFRDSDKINPWGDYLQKDFIKSEVGLEDEELRSSFVAQQLLFSHYYFVCRDIENFSRVKFKEHDVALIRDKLDDIQEILYAEFSKLYRSCMKKHPSSQIKTELEFMDLLKGKYTFEKSSNKEPSKSFVNLEDVDLTSASKTSPSQIKRSKLNQPEEPSSPLESEILTEKGTILNDLLLHKEAIKILSAAIKINRANTSAYIERAIAYFETDQLDLALSDYAKAKELTIFPPFILRAKVSTPKNKLEFTKGVIKGIWKGAEQSGEDILSSCKGLAFGLWAFVSSPVNTTKEMADAAYEIGLYFYQHSAQECFDCLIPEIGELVLRWDSIDDHDKGHHIGFIIGKYGIEIFAPGAALKGVNKYKALKRANAMCTLECCSLSELNRAKIAGESLKFSTKRQVIISNSLTDGRILVKNANVKCHIMQKKHAWEKLIKLSGNVEEDFNNVLKMINSKFISKDIKLKGVANFPKDVGVKTIKSSSYTTSMGLVA